MGEPKITTSQGQESISEAAKLLSHAFAHDASINFFLSDLSQTKREAFRTEFFKGILIATVQNRGSLEEINNWESCGVLVPPNAHADNLSNLIPVARSLLPILFRLGYNGNKRLLITNPAKEQSSKKIMFPDGEKPHYHVLFLGTHESARGKGLCSAMIKHYQAISARENVPIYMEASTEYAWDLYKKLGFMTLNETYLGKGTHGPDGNLLKGGAGVRGWGMMWPPNKDVAA